MKYSSFLLWHSSLWCVISHSFHSCIEVCATSANEHSRESVVRSRTWLLVHWTFFQSVWPSASYRFRADRRVKFHGRAGCLQNFDQFIQILGKTLFRFSSTFFFHLCAIFFYILIKQGGLQLSLVSEGNMKLLFLSQKIVNLQHMFK